MAEGAIKKPSKYTPGDVVFNIINYAVFILFALICLFPFYYLFINTISDNNLVGAGRIQLVPKGFNLQNYANLTIDVPIKYFQKHLKKWYKSVIMEVWRKNLKLTQKS